MTKNNPSPKAIKIPFDSLTLRAVVSELQSRLIGGQVQEVRQPEPTELRLGIRCQGQNHILALSIDARFARIHLTEVRSPNAPTPPTFCMTLRKHIEGGTIAQIRQRDFDRIVELVFTSRNASGEPTTFTLIAELMGKHSNLILVTETGQIVDAAKRISRRVNRVRETLPGLPYLPPPPQEGKINPFAPDALKPLQTVEVLSDTPLNERLLTLYEGLSPFLAAELAMHLTPRPPSLIRSSLAGKGGTEVSTLIESARTQQIDSVKVAWEQAFGRARRNDYQPTEITLANGRLAAYPFPTMQLPTENQKAVSDLNAALDRVYRQEEAWAEFEAITGDLRSRLEREAKRLEKQKQSVERTIQESHRAEEYKQAGELLLANLWKLETGMNEVTVQDYYSPEQTDRAIPLDIKLTPQENVQAYFRRYRKAVNGQERALDRSIELESSLTRVMEAKAKFTLLQQEGIGATGTIRQMQERLLAEGLLREQETEREEERKQGRPDFAGHKISRVTTAEGYEILIGETATANDYLTTRLAASNDFWLHVRAATSAHVVIRTLGKPERVPRGVLEQAALLCARHSGQKHSSLVPVDYTLKKYVRKPRGAAPGSVVIQQEKTLHVTP